MDGYDVNPRAAQCLEDALELVFVHREVAIHNSLLITAGEGCPGIDAHRVTDDVAIYLGGSTEGDLINAVAQLTLGTDDGLDLRWIERALGRLNLSSRHYAFATTGFFDLSEHFAYGRCQLR